MDMSQSFKAAVDQALGHPVVVADRFHFCAIYLLGIGESVCEKERNRIHLMIMIVRIVNECAMYFISIMRT